MYGRVINLELWLNVSSKTEMEETNICKDVYLLISNYLLIMKISINMQDSPTFSKGIFLLQ